MTNMTSLTQSHVTRISCLQPQFIHVKLKCYVIDLEARDGTDRRTDRQTGREREVH